MSANQTVFILPSQVPKSGVVSQGVGVLQRAESLQAATIQDTKQMSVGKVFVGKEMAKLKKTRERLMNSRK